jgi:hypothetical protein
VQRSGHADLYCSAQLKPSACVSVCVCVCVPRAQRRRHVGGVCAATTGGVGGGARCPATGGVEPTPAPAARGEAPYAPPPCAPPEPAAASEGAAPTLSPSANRAAAARRNASCASRHAQRLSARNAHAPMQSEAAQKRRSSNADAVTLLARRAWISRVLKSQNSRPGSSGGRRLGASRAGAPGCCAAMRRWKRERTLCCARCMPRHVGTQRAPPLLELCCSKPRCAACASRRRHARRA